LPSILKALDQGVVTEVVEKSESVERQADELGKVEPV
jgi:hypothetical protein